MTCSLPSHISYWSVVLLFALVLWCLPRFSATLIMYVLFLSTKFFSFSSLFLRRNPISLRWRRYGGTDRVSGRPPGGGLRRSSSGSWPPARPPAPTEQSPTTDTDGVTVTSSLPWRHRGVGRTPAAAECPRRWQLEGLTRPADLQEQHIIRDRTYGFSWSSVDGGENSPIRVVSWSLRDKPVPHYTLLPNMEKMTGPADSEM